ncbi:DUF5765 domain-containing protein [Aestuariivita boseongensis]|uniref:DUF5765 domain-containing protein n=1 Tax=Aestuariivita boseongensis TaxID=1470562 RepID=UPI001FDFF4AF|nr:DUF5765 domain-containing protein [Aestuariivita boseongensis]
MTGLGFAATAVTYRRGATPAIWGTLGFFTFMEALQVWGYMVLDQCGTASNETVTRLSYLHIVVQPFFINAFAMELIPSAVKQRVRMWVFGACAVSSLIMLVQIAPVPALGDCAPGSPLCGERWCTVSGDWHIAWDVPYNGLLVPLDKALGMSSGFPSYMVAAFLLPLLYGAWRFVLMHALAGPILAASLTTNPNEMPAVWCLFSIAILLIGLSAPIRRVVSTERWWGRDVPDSA